MSRMAAAPVRAKSSPVTTSQRSQGPRPCALVGVGCKRHRTKDSIFCYGHGRRIDKWAHEKESKRKERLQDLARWRSFHDYSGKESD